MKIVGKKDEARTVDVSEVSAGAVFEIRGAYYLRSGGLLAGKVSGIHLRTGLPLWHPHGVPLKVRLVEMEAREL